jgi:hypothetical protein
MWQIYTGSANKNVNNWNEDILAANRQNSICHIVRSIPDLYYMDVNKPFILDKCRTWTLPGNVTLIKKFITNNPKIIVLVRPTEEIVSSFAHLRMKNGWDENKIHENIFDETDPTMDALKGVVSAKHNNRGEFLFVQYDEIVFDTKKTLNRIYDFCEWPKYEHQLENINRPFIQNDEVYNLNGLHDVRRTVEKQKYHIDLPKDIMKKCRYLNSLIFED